MKKKTDQRPDIKKISTAAELRRWYWLKTELAAEARRLGIKSTGAKFTLLERLCHFHKTGSKVWPGEKVSPDDKSAGSKSKFDWHSEPLTPATVITNSYKNTQNVRRFFKQHVDPEFKFNIAFMEWIKTHPGKTLSEAGAYWKSQQANNAPTKIKPHNQFNQYLRDFMQDNPESSISDARKAWAQKKKQPSKTGRHKYQRSDRSFLS